MLCSLSDHIFCLAPFQIVGMAPKVPKVVITIDSDSPTEVTVKVGSGKSSTGGIEITERSKIASNSGVQDKNESKTDVSSPYPHSGSSKDKRGGQSMSQGEIPLTSRKPNAGDDDWDKVSMVVDQDEGPRQPDHPPPGWSSPRPPTDSPPSPKSPLEPPPWKAASRSEAATDPSSSTPEQMIPAGESLCMTRKAGRVYHKRTCGILKHKNDDELIMDLAFCEICAVVMPQKQTQRFAISATEVPRKLHYISGLTVRHGAGSVASR